MQITKHTVVGFRYRMLNGRGEVLEDILEGSPAAYLHGSGNILPALEARMEGLIEGDSRTITISGEEGFEGVDDQFCFEVVIDFIRAATEEEITRGCPKEEAQDWDDCPDTCICNAITEQELLSKS